MTAEAHLFAPGAWLPESYGRGMTERAVEFGWAMAQNPHGRVLDAGSTFNHPFALDALLPKVEALTIATLAPEASSYPARGVIYVYEDLRALPFPDDSFDTILSISVLEHVGLDTTLYGAEAAPAVDPQVEAIRAVKELVRVARPGGTVLISVPFGRPSRHGWVRVLDQTALDELIQAANPRAQAISLYRDSGHGWQVTTAEAAGLATYRTYQAEAVACARLQLRD